MSQHGKSCGFFCFLVPIAYRVGVREYCVLNKNVYTLVEAYYR